MIIAVLCWLIGASAFLALRLYPIWRTRQQGCDAYYILLCAEAFRADRRLPIRLPALYLLEDCEQWYPPGFLLLCAAILPRLLKNYYWLINHLLDLLHITLLFVLACRYGQLPAGFAAIIIYGLSPGLILEYANFNTRPLAVLLLSSFLVMAFFAPASVSALLMTFILGVLLFYSHKLTMQQLWFTLPMLAITTGDWRWLAWLPAIYAAAFALWPRGCRRLLFAHAAIVSFWHRHWRLLGAHAVRQSPIYGDGVTRTEFYREDRGWRAALSLGKETLHQNYFIIPTIAVAAQLGWSDPIDRFLLSWSFSVYMAVILIHNLPILRGIGLARQYVKFALFPTFLYLVLHVGQLGWGTLALLGLAIVLVVRQYALIVANSRRGGPGQTAQVSAELMAHAAALRREPWARVLCLPVHLADIVAYFARVPTYWGAHSDRFDEKLASFFPVLQRRIEDYAADDGLTHLLLDRRYVDPSELDLKSEPIASSSNYLLFRLTGDVQSQRTPGLPTSASAS